jgi:hypothetical protein
VVARVRAQKDYRRGALRGMTGKVLRRYGNHGRGGLDVRPAEGRGMLFWPRELQEIAAAHLHGCGSLLEGIPAG